MNKIGCPKPIPNHFVVNLRPPRVRWQCRIVPVGGHEDLVERVMVLQQQAEDGYGDLFWVDVPVVDEKEEEMI